MVPTCGDTELSEAGRAAHLIPRDDFLLCLGKGPALREPCSVRMWFWRLQVEGVMRGRYGKGR